MFREVYQLMSEGGFTELLRGIRDYSYYSSFALLFVLIYSSRTLVVDSVSVSFTISNTESLRRALGHGETDVITDFLSEVSANSVVWDVGANQGTYSLFAAECGGEVHAFEPGTSAADILERNLRLNQVSSVTVHRFALGAENKAGVLQHGHRSGVRQVANDGDGDPIEIRRGDDVPVTAPEVLKIDVEGAEVDVLRGLGAVLDSCRVCYVEIHDNNRAAVVSVLDERGFEVAERYSNSLKFTRADGSDR